MRKIKNVSSTEWWLLVVAVVVSVLVVVFAPDYEYALYGGSDGFADLMDNNNMYAIMAILSTAVVWVMALVYYLAIDSVSLSGFWKWLFVGLIAVGVAFACQYYYPLSTFDAITIDNDTAGYIYSFDVMSLAIINIPVNIIYFLIVSIGLKGFSQNCGTRPF